MGGKATPSRGFPVSRPMFQGREILSASYMASCISLFQGNRVSFESLLRLSVRHPVDFVSQAFHLRLTFPTFFPIPSNLRLKKMNLRLDSFHFVPNIPHTFRKIVLCHFRSKNDSLSFRERFVSFRFRSSFRLIPCTSCQIRVGSCRLRRKSSSADEIAHDSFPFGIRPVSPLLGVSRVSAPHKRG